MFTSTLAKIALKLGILSPLKFVFSLIGRWFNNQKNDSLIRFTKATRVEPIALVDQRLVHQPYMPDVMQTLSSVFIGYYLQAVSLAVNVGKINVIKLLDTLNPTRDVADAAATKIVDELNKSNKADLLSFESYRYKLPTPGMRASMESEKDEIDILIDKTKEKLKDQMIESTKSNIKAIEDSNSDKGNKLGFGKDTIKSASEAVNLSVGKLIEVTVGDGNASAVFPITIRLISTIVGSDILVHILGDGSRNITAKERYHAWRSGQLEFIKDLVLCQDLIDEHKATLKKDKTGIYSKILERRHNNKAASFLSGNPSIATASNLLVLSKQTVKELELATGGKFSNPQFRDKVFQNTYLMLVIVVDMEYEHVTIFHRGIAIPSELSIRELKAANKGTGPDVAEILKSYQLGANPTI